MKSPHPVWEMIDEKTHQSVLDTALLNFTLQDAAKASTRRISPSSWLRTWEAGPGTRVKRTEAAEAEQPWDPQSEQRTPESVDQHQLPKDRRKPDKDVELHRRGEHHPLVAT